MTTQPGGANLYSQGVGTAPSNSLITAIRSNRNPATTDVRGPSGNYPIGQRWINTSSNTTYTLTSLSASSSVISATWTQDGGSGTIGIQTLTGDSGGAVGPSGGNVSLVGSGTITVVGSPGASTLTIQDSGGSGVENFITDAGVFPVSPSGGSIIITGAQITAGTTSTALRTFGSGGTVSLQIQRTSSAISPNVNINGISHFDSTLFSVDNAGFVSLNSVPISQITQTVFTNDGVYSKNADLKFAVMECVGGGGGGAVSTPPGGMATDVAAGGGGGAGEYAYGIFASASIMGGQTVTIGAGGTVGVNGSNTSVGSLISAFGGNTGEAAQGSGAISADGGNGGTGGTGGSYRVNGSFGGASYVIYYGSGDTIPVASFLARGGFGGSSSLGNGCAEKFSVSPTSISLTGDAGQNYGSGGGGAASTGLAGSKNGGTGANGVVIITEFI